ncbi:response regulator [Pseudolysinimonas sp.]|uniref:response regulator n=1 Tax=Pseudolysinimonas sp. TaxID=2680009 RepID=UPI003F7EE309
MVLNPAAVRVAIVDDEALVRSGFSLILDAAEGIDVVGTSDGIGALALIAETQPDVVLLDIRMPGVDGLAVLRQARRAPAPPAFLMLTTFDADEYVMTALDEGASGFLLKDTDPDQLHAMVRAVAGGGIVLSPLVSGRLVERRREVTEAAPDLSALTPRERDVLAAVGEGLTNAEIARALHLSPATVKDHVSAVLLKLGVSGRVQAALIAQRAAGARARPDRP